MEGEDNNPGCIECGSIDHVIEHHVRYEPEETVMLCRSCHREAHERENHEYNPKQLKPETFEYDRGDKTAITVSEATWKRLNNRKSLGQTMDDILSNALDEYEARGFT